MRHTHTNRVITDRPAATPPGFERNWIDYRHSLVHSDVRTDNGETVRVCPDCDCETDIVPAPHSPNCKVPL